MLALWANLHAGFAFGLGLIGLYALLQTEQAIRHRQPIPRAAWVGVVCAALAACVNPWGFAIYEVPFQHIYAESPFGELVEWQGIAASLDPRTYAGRFWWIVAFALLGAAGGRATRFSIALAAVTAVMAIGARRFIPLFAISATPLAALGLVAILDVARRRNPIWSFAEQAWSAMGHCEEALDALRQIRLGGPFVADQLRDEVRTQIRDSECSPVEYTSENRRSNLKARG